MSGISGVSGFGGLETMAMLGTSVLQSTSLSGMSAVGAASASNTVAALAGTETLQSLIRSIQEFGTTEVLLALLLAARSERKEDVGNDRPSVDLFAALALANSVGQRTSANIQYEMPTTNAVTSSGMGTINVSA